MYTNGRQMLVSTNPFPASWTSSISHDEETGHIIMDGTPICLLYDSSGRLAALEGCPSVVAGQNRHLTCEQASDTGLVCNIPAMRCGSSDCTDLGGVWNRFYLLSWEEGVWLIVIGADDLSQNDVPLQSLESISMAIETV
jgi:hypothetical protein